MEVLFWRHLWFVWFSKAHLCWAYESYSLWRSYGFYALFNESSVVQFLLRWSPEVGLIEVNVSWIDFEEYKSSHALAESRHLLFVDGWFQAKSNQSGFWIWTRRGNTLSSDLDFREAVDIDRSILWEETIRFLCGQGRPVVAGALFVEFESGKE